MVRLLARTLLMIPLLALGACGDDPPPATTANPAPSAPAEIPTSAPAPSATVSSPPVKSTTVKPPGIDAPAPTESVYVEEDDDPTAAPGDLTPQGQAFLDQALGTELAALEASGDKGKQRRAVLDKLPKEPKKVLAALRTYSWWSPEAKAFYDKAVATAK